MATQHFRLAINISYDDFLAYYERQVSDVIAPDIQGKQVRFPASALQQFLTHSGVSGIFELTVDDNNKLLSCQRIADI